MSLLKFSAVMSMVLSICACSRAHVRKDASHPESKSPAHEIHAALEQEAPATTSTTLPASTTPEARIQAMEAKIAELSDKLEATRASLVKAKEVAPTRSIAPPLPSDQKLPVISHPAEKYQGAIAVSTASNDPEAGFSSDPSIQAFRKAFVLFQSEKFPEAVLAFSSFLEAYPDHPLAGAGQYYIGRSYFKQQEYKLAVQEYQKVLTSYDRSSHVSDTLREMAEAEDHLRLTESAAKHRQLLTSLFPHSPAAGVQLSQAPQQNTMPAKSATPPAKTTLDEPPPPTAPMGDAIEKEDE